MVPFSKCFLAKYSEIKVVAKEYKGATSSTEDNSFEWCRKEATHEAPVIQQLGDHPGIPLLFGVMLKQQPVSIVLKFHGNGHKSLTLIKETKEKKDSEKGQAQNFL